MKKIWIALAAVVGVLVIAAVIVVMNLNRIIEANKDTILARVERQIGRDVEVGKVHASLWPGIGIKAEYVSVSEDPVYGSTPFAESEAVVVSLRFKPLLNKRVEINRLTLHHPRIVVIKNEAGRFNYESMVPGAVDPGEKVSTQSASPALAAGALPLALALCDIEDGEIQYEDQQMGTTHVIRKLDFAARDVGLGQEMSLQLACALLSDEQDLHVEGTFGPIAAATPEAALLASIAITARIGPVAVADVLALMPTTAGASPLSPGTSIDGLARLEVTVTGVAGAPLADVSVDLRDVGLAMDRQFHKPRGENAQLRMRVRSEAKTVVVEQLEVVVGTLTVAGSARIAEQTQVQLSADNLAVTELARFVPALQEMGASGDLSLTVNTTAPRPSNGAKPEVRGTLRIRNGAATVPALIQPVQNANFVVEFGTATARVSNATLSIGKTRLTGSFNAASLMPLDGSFHVETGEAWRTDFQPAPVPPPRRAEVLRGVVVDGRLMGNDAGAIRHETKLTSKSGVLAEVDYTELSATLRGDTTETIVDRYTVRALDGTVSGDGKFRPTDSPPTFQIQAVAENINTAEFFRDRYPSLPEFIDGRINLSLGLTGKGDTWAAIQPTLGGDADGLIKEGRLLNVNVARQFVDGVQALPLVPANFSERVKSKYPDLFNANHTIVRNLKGILVIRNGRMETNNLTFASDGFDVSGVGSFGLDRTIDLKTTLRVSQAMTQVIIAELPAAKYLADGSGRIEVPMHIGGDAARPRFALDTSAMGSKLQQGLVGEGATELQDRLKGLLGGKKKPQ